MGVFIIFSFFRDDGKGNYGKLWKIFFFCICVYNVFSYDIFWFNDFFVI